mmetsp:Transcript_92107/g.201874  ORF Transcript_92107/g.201874 Transcript_92107/m.201874 type:complete len:225 (+) Transcript_92107:960-1634(+)
MKLFKVSSLYLMLPSACWPKKPLDSHSPTNSETESFLVKWVENSNLPSSTGSPACCAVDHFSSTLKASSFAFGSSALSEPRIATNVSRVLASFAPSLSESGVAATASAGKMSLPVLGFLPLLKACWRIAAVCGIEVVTTVLWEASRPSQDFSFANVPGRFFGSRTDNFLAARTAGESTFPIVSSLCIWVRMLTCVLACVCVCVLFFRRRGVRKETNVLLTQCQH